MGQYGTCILLQIRDSTISFRVYTSDIRESFPAEDASNVGEVNITYTRCLPREILSRGRRESRFWRTLKNSQVGKLIRSRALRRRS